MCGICGILPKRGTTPDDIAATRRMNAKLVHRGPDSEGYFTDSRVAIGMRRLSIIDVDHGSQPLFNEDRSIILIANGEIYNFVELRKELEAAGHRFATGSDCETIIHAYEQFGAAEFIQRLRGMFAFCLYDAGSGRVILARDRLGEKPLYICGSGGMLAFSSELKSILEAAPASSRALDRQSVYSYFYYGYVPGERTMFEGIRKLAPGHALSIDLATGSSSEIQYWKKPDEEGSAASGAPGEIVRKELDDIERIIIRSDVPVGVSLSGGLDSSIIATLAARYSDKKLHAFSVGYPGGPANDERAAAKRLADELGFEFHGIEIDEHQFDRDLPVLIGSMDEPISDIAAYGYYAVSREARSQKVPVLLAGFGGDELFWGYPWVRDAARLNDLKRTFPGKVWAFAMLVVRSWRMIARSPATMQQAWRSAFSDRAVLYELAPQWMRLRQQESLVFEKAFLGGIDRNGPYDAESRPLGRHNGIVVTDLIESLWLGQNCIDLGDRMSMAHSIELRLPLVDHRLYEKVAEIRRAHPQDYSLGYKRWLIDAAKGFLPTHITDRPKRGFTPPTTLWVKHAIRSNREAMLNGYLVRNRIIRRSYIERALAAPERDIRFLYSALVFELWAKRYLS